MTTEPIRHWCADQIQVLRSRTGDIALDPLRVEASHRAFYRAVDNHSSESWVVMFSPPSLENNQQFEALAHVFSGLGTPELFAVDHARGYFLMEDFGTEHLVDAYDLAGNNAERRGDILNFALDSLLPLQRIQDPAVPVYDEDRLIMEFDLCSEWFATQLMDQPLTTQDSAVLSQARSQLTRAMLEQPQVCVHRDFHCRNLLLHSHNGSQRLGIVDFQDALVGPILYDPASLLQDCYVVHDESLIRKCLARFATNTPALASIEQGQLHWWHDACAMQRQIKAVGIFARLHLRDAKSSHLNYIPSVLGRAATLASTYQETRDLAQLLRHWADEASTKTLLTAVPKSNKAHKT